MKSDKFNSELNNIWGKAASKKNYEKLTQEVDFYKKLLSFFQVGDSYYYIFNVKDYSIDMVSSDCKKVLGYEQEEMIVSFILDKIHPEDRPWFLNFEKKAVSFLTQLPKEKLMKYKRRYDYRIRKKNGDYIRILQQTMVIEHDEESRILRSFGVHTDITYLKPVGKPILSFIGLDGEPSYINVDVDKEFTLNDNFLTSREKEVLTQLIEGRQSKEIADFFCISKETVDKHRQNMLRKNGLSNTAELISNAIRKGWL